MQGQCVQKVGLESGEYYKQVLNGIWEENDELWEFFQEGPSSERFVLIEFVPAKISVM